MGEVIKMKPGKIDINEMKKKLNKKAGLEVAHSLGNGNDPSSVVDWIPTGSRWLDSIISIKGMAGIPIGKIFFSSSETPASSLNRGEGFQVRSFLARYEVFQRTFFSGSLRLAAS